MQPSILTTLATVLVASMSLVACATDDGSEIPELDITLASDDGTKADAIDGKQLRIRTDARVSPWNPSGDETWQMIADLDQWKTVKVDLATSSTAIVTGNWFAFQGTDDVFGLEDSPWSDDTLLQLTIEKKPGSTARMGFVIQDVLWKRAPFTCARMGGVERLNYFESLTISLKNREVYANDKVTFTFAECGIDDGTAHKALAGADAGKPAWNFEVFVVPLETTGALKGTYEYRLKAELI